jgi:hypothetical protein
MHFVSQAVGLQRGITVKAASKLSVAGYLTGDIARSVTFRGRIAFHAGMMYTFMLVDTDLPHFLTQDDEVPVLIGTSMEDD